MDGLTGASGTAGGLGAEPTTAALLAAVVLPDGSGSGFGSGAGSGSGAGVGADRLLRPHPGFPVRGDGGVLDPVFAAGVVAAAEWLAEQEAVYDASVAALTQWGRLEARVAAGKVREVERLCAASDRISAGLGLDSWQRQEAVASTTAELAAALCLPEATANALLSESVALVHDRPRTLAALTAGDLSYRHAEVILDEVGSLTAVAEPGIPAGVAEEFESRLLAVAPGLTVPKFRARARKWREREHPETMVSRHKAAVTKRRLQLTADRDGMSYLTGYMPSPTAQGIWNRATKAARAAQCPDEPRTLSQLRLDIAADWLLNNTTPHTIAQNNSGRNSNGNGDGDGDGDGTGAGAGLAGAGSVEGGAGEARDAGDATVIDVVGPAGVEELEDLGELDEVDDPDELDEGIGSAGGCPFPRAQVLVTVPVFALLGLTDEPAELEGYGPIPPDMARQLAAECPEMIRLLIHPHTGEPLAIGRERYRVTGRMRAWLRARDQTCTFTGCNTVTADTQLDHITGWEHGSGTSDKELTDECKKHHLIKHLKDGKDRHGKRTAAFATRDGTSPDGETSVGDRPGPRLRGWTPSMTHTGQTAWTSPAGTYYPPPPPDHHPPRLPPLLPTRLAARRPARLTDPGATTTSKTGTAKTAKVTTGKARTGKARTAGTIPAGATVRRTTPPPDPCQDATYRALYLIDSQIPHDPEGSTPAG